MDWVSVSVDADSQKGDQLISPTCICRDVCRTVPIPGTNSAITATTHIIYPHNPQRGAHTYFGYFSVNLAANSGSIYASIGTGL